MLLSIHTWSCFLQSLVPSGSVSPPAAAVSILPTPGYSTTTVSICPTFWNGLIQTFTQWSESTLPPGPHPKTQTLISLILTWHRVRHKLRPELIWHWWISSQMMIRQRQIFVNIYSKAKYIQNSQYRIWRKSFHSNNHTMTLEWWWTVCQWRD